jgi:hypothetical protein
LKSEHSSHDWHVQPDCQRSKSLIHTRWGALDSVLPPKLPDFLETYGSHTQAGAQRALQPCFCCGSSHSGDPLLRRLLLTYRFLSCLSTALLNFFCRHQLCQSALTCSYGSQGVQPVDGLLRRACNSRWAHDKTACGLLVTYSRRDSDAEAQH